MSDMLLVTATTKPLTDITSALTACARPGDPVLELANRSGAVVARNDEWVLAGYVKTPEFSDR